MRLARRVGRGPAPRRRRPTERPIGVKLELTHSCNLRCDFCYTDSPRHTVARTTDLDDDAWRRIVDEALELGVIEAVVTGGEPLLRAPLTLELLERLGAARVATVLNTNGWFVDETIADRLATLPDLTVNISVDGASPGLHDAARGVPGSWRRAVRAIALLLERDVSVCVGHVVTPLNAAWVPELLEHMWLLGVRAVRLTPVVPIGAASREDGWTVDRRALRRAVAAAGERYGEGFRALVQGGTGEIVATRDEHAPAALLVRPNGDVLIDSLQPFAFGRVENGLAACWARIVTDWDHPDITRWADGIRNSRGLASATVVPYADDSPIVGGPAPTRRGGSRPPVRLPRRSARSTQPAVEPDDLGDARRHVLGLTLARHHRLAPLHWSGDTKGARVVRLLDSGRVCRLNRTAGPLLDRLVNGTVGEATAALAAEHPEVPSGQIELDAIRSLHWLRARGVVLGAPASVAG